MSTSSRQRASAQDRYQVTAPLPTAQSDLGGSTAATMPIGQALWRFKVTLVLAILAALALGSAYTARQPLVYESEARLLLSPPTGGIFSGVNEIDAERYLRNEVERLRSARVQTDALNLIQTVVTAEPDMQQEQAEIGAPYVPANLVELEKRLTITPALDLDLITITSTGPTAQMTALTANSVMDSYREVVSTRARAQAAALNDELRLYEEEVSAQLRGAELRLGGIRSETQLQIEAEPVDPFNPVDLFLELNRRLDSNPEFDALERRRNALQSELTEVQTRIREVAVDRRVASPGIDFIESAPVPGRASGPRRLVNLLIAGLLGAMLGLALVAQRASAYDRVSSRRSIEDLTGVRHLVDVPLFSKLYNSPVPVTRRPGSLAADSLQALAGAVSLALEDLDASVLLISSPRPRDGKTMVSINLALALATDGRTVALIDGDQRARALTRMIGVDPSVGLRQVARDDPAGVLALESPLPLPEDTRVIFFPPGKAERDPAAFFRSSAFGLAMNHIRAEADVVIIDAPPLLASSEVTALAPAVDAVLLVTRNGAHAGDLEATGARLRILTRPVIGFVRNRVSWRNRGGRTRAARNYRPRRLNIFGGLGRHQTFKPWSIRTRK